MVVEEFEDSLQRLHRTADEIEAAVMTPGRQDAVRWAQGLTIFPSIEPILVNLQREISVDFVGLTLMSDTHNIFVVSTISQEPCVREDSHCQQVVGSGEPLAIRDARSSRIQRLMPRAFATQEMVKAYLGVPLSGHDQVLGSLCAVNLDGPRDWAQHDIDRMKEVSAQITSMLHRASPVEGFTS